MESKIDNLGLKVVLGVGLATFFFGFGAAAVLNLYLLVIHSKLVLQFRSSLNYVSSILGDGIILPIINMFVASFLFRNRQIINKLNIALALIFGLTITLYFNIVQAAEGLVNWSMPTPWHWNFLGIWHALYMFSVASLLSLFYIVLILYARKYRKLPWQSAVAITIGLLVFFTLLRLDYTSVSLGSLLPFAVFAAKTN
ncbi:MAG: hypothetical protein M1372_01910 [Patescibacteria group bacterium]|nr:hypothetical protein [Patescibacteria group bacterium]